MGGIRYIFVALAMLASPFCGSARTVIEVPCGPGDMTLALREALEDASRHCGRGGVEIRLAPAVYNISKEMAVPLLRHVSNTTSREENPMALKHFGLYLKGLSDITIDGRGATLLTHGEMTAIAIDSCRNIRVRNLTIDASDPSVAEMRVVFRTDSILVAELAATTRCRIDSLGKLYWQGEGWEFTGGIAQRYDGVHTLRCDSPLDRYTSAELLGSTVTLHYAEGGAPDCHAGDVFQMRHSLRTEVATLIDRSAGVEFMDVTYRFLGNFGIVGQFSENLTFERVTCAPDPASDRTCAGFADFMQMSGCSGKVKIKDCRFAGSQDDPINIHGTYLKVIASDGARLTARFSHPQTYGFLPFAAGDEIALVDVRSMLPFAESRVVGARMIDDYDVELQLADDIGGLMASHRGVAIENLTATPEVEITGCTFTLTPTRGILLTTPRRTVISHNTFIGIPMSAVLISGDCRSWYESGAVNDVTISHNRFIDCAAPAIRIAPENAVYEGPVHTGIRITDNTFIFSALAPGAPMVSAKATSGLTLLGNRVLWTGEQQDKENSATAIVQRTK